MICLVDTPESTFSDVEALFPCSVLEKKKLDKLTIAVLIYANEMQEYIIR